MAFLDKNNRVIDVVLTSYGKHKMSTGELNFEYFCLFDDEVDYDPYIANSASLTTEQIEEQKIKQIEETLVREASFGKFETVKIGLEDSVNVNNNLYTNQQGFTVLPEFQLKSEVTSGSIETNQTKIVDYYLSKDKNGKVLSKNGPYDAGFIKSDSTTINLDLKIKNFYDENCKEGVLLTVFESGSDGLSEVKSKRDFSNVLSYNEDLIVFVDDEIENEVSKLLKSDKDMEQVFGIVRKK